MYNIPKRLEDAVLKEALALNKYTTDTEKSKLVPLHIDPRSMNGCIYGSISGQCYNDRAIELLKLCAPLTIGFRSKGLPFNITITEMSLEQLDSCVNEENCDLGNRDWVNVRCWSPIEVAIIKDRSIIRKVIDVIKGISTTL